MKTLKRLFKIMLSAINSGDILHYSMYYTLNGGEKKKSFLKLICCMAHKHGKLKYIHLNTQHFRRCIKNNIPNLPFDK